jgi:acetyl esterase/lipase
MRIALPLLVVSLVASVANVGHAQDPQWSPPSGVRFTPDVVYGKGGGRDLVLDVLEPVTRPTELMPALIYVHGGGWSGGNKRAGRRFNAAYAERGYFTVTVGYRLSGEAVFPAQIHDVKAAVRWLRANAKARGVDPERIGVWGHSAGGHLAALIGTSSGVAALEGSGGNADEATTVRCVVDVFGPNDLVDLDLTASEYWGKVRRKLLAKLLGGVPEKTKDLARAASPVAYVSKDDPPVLIVHGTKDPLVPFRQATLFEEALKAGGVEAILLPVKGAAHGWKDKPDVDAAIAAFFAKQLRRSAPR